MAFPSTVFVSLAAWPFSLLFGFLLWGFIFSPWLRRAVPCCGEALHLLLELSLRLLPSPGSDTTLSLCLAKPKAIPTGPDWNGYFGSVFCFSGMVRSSSYLLFPLPVGILVLNKPLVLSLSSISISLLLVEPLEEITHSSVFSFKLSQFKTSTKSLKPKLQHLHSRESWPPCKCLQGIFSGHPEGLQSSTGWNASSPPKDEAFV